MRSLFAGMMMLSASMAVVDIAQAQTQPPRPPGYGSVQAPIGHRQPTKYGLQDDVMGAGQLHSSEDSLTNRIGQDNPSLDREITDICPSCGDAEDAPAHHGSRPIHHDRL